MKESKFPKIALAGALLLGFLSILPYFGLHFDYIPGDLGDNRLNNYLLEHGFHSFMHRTPASFFDAPFFYPARASIRHSESLLGSVPFYIPWRLMGIDRETSFQIWIVLGYMLNYLAAAWVLSKMRFHWFAALGGAYIFAFSQAALTHSWHIQLHYRFAIPLAWYFLHLFLEQFRPKHLVLTLSFVAWQFYCSVYEGYLLALFLGAFVLVKLCTSTVFQRFFRSITVRSLATYGVILLGFAIAVLALAKAYISSVSDPQLIQARRQEVITMLPRPVSYLVSFPGSSETGWLYNAIDLPMKHEHVMFVGLIPWIGVLTLLITARRIRQHSESVAVLLAMFLMIIATLYVNGFSFYFVLMKLPGVAGMRAVTRLILILLLPFAIATAQVLHLCLERVANAGKLTIAAFLMIVSAGLMIENRTNPYRYSKEEGRERVRELAAQFPSQWPSNPVLAYLYPLGGDSRLPEIDAMLAAQEKNIFTMNGYSGSAPEGFRSLHTCTDIRLALDDIALHNQAFPVRDAASQIVAVGTPLDGPCTNYLSRHASTASQPLPDEGFRAGIEVGKPPVITANSDFLLQVRITNESSVLWHARGLQSGKFALRVSCQWLTMGSEIALMEYPNRFDLPYDLQPNESASIAALLTAPAGAGKYTLECDAVQELVHWFHLMGSKTGKAQIDVQRDPATPAVQAFLDVVNADEIGGWAWDQDHPASAVQIEVRDGDRKVATIAANRFRKDLLEAGIGSGAYGFSIPNPLRSSDGKMHVVHVLIAGTNIELMGSPKAFTPAR